jgi:hypothetical protein
MAISRRVGAVGRLLIVRNHGSIPATFSISDACHVFKEGWLPFLLREQ